MRSIHIDRQGDQTLLASLTFKNTVRDALRMGAQAFGNERKVWTVQWGPGSRLYLAQVGMLASALRSEGFHPHDERGQAQYLTTDDRHGLAIRIIPRSGRLSDDGAEFVIRRKGQTTQDSLAENDSQLTLFPLNVYVVEQSDSDEFLNMWSIYSYDERGHRISSWLVMGRPDASSTRLVPLDYIVLDDDFGLNDPRERNRPAPAPVPTTDFDVEDIAM